MSINMLSSLSIDSANIISDENFYTSLKKNVCVFISKFGTTRNILLSEIYHVTLTNK